MIFLCGIPSEPSLGMVIEEVRKLGVPSVVFNQHHFTQLALEFQIAHSQVVGHMQLADQIYRLENFTGIYTRLMDFRHLPEIANEMPNSQTWRYCRALHDTLSHWFEIAPIRVLNRTRDIGSVFSKPFQAQLIRKHGFLIPETIITSDPDLAREFRSEYEKVIYKSISYVRSIVQVLSDAELQRLDHIRWCPTQFQEFVEGNNVRVHVIGHEVFATFVSANATDYRYAYLSGEQEKLEAVDLPSTLRERCLGLCSVLGLEFAGIDLRVTPDNRVYCFEVNPGPAFSYYEYHTGQPIAEAVAKYLAGIT